MKQIFIELTELESNNKLLVPLNRILYFGQESTTGNVVVVIENITTERFVTVLDKYEDIKKAIGNA
jgi:hypothetical protein